MNSVLIVEDEREISNFIKKDLYRGLSATIKVLLQFSDSKSDAYIVLTTRIYLAVSATPFYLLML